MKPNINSVEVHPQLSNTGHPVDGALVGAGSLWPNSLVNVPYRASEYDGCGLDELEPLDII